MLKKILIIKLLIFNLNYANSYNINENYNINEKLNDNYIIQYLDDIFINLSSYAYNISHPITDPLSYISYNSSLK